MTLQFEASRSPVVLQGGRCLFLAILATSFTLACGRTEESSKLQNVDNGFDEEFDATFEEQFEHETHFSAASKAARRATNYPVVLHHGMLGSSRILFMDYFYGVPRHIGQRRGQKIFVTRVSPVHSIKFRAEQLAHQIDEILAKTKADKVNVIAHSMGGLDTRHLISTMGYGDRIASLVTIGTPHRGSPIANLAHVILGRRGERAHGLFEKITGVRAGEAEAHGFPIDLPAQIWNLTTDYTTKVFNPNNPDDPQVYYQSWAGQTSVSGITTGDIVDPLFLPMYMIMAPLTGPNDGMVSVASSRWGDFGGVVPADHLDIIGQLFGTTSVFFNHLAFYDTIVNGLVRRGF